MLGRIAQPPGRDRDALRRRSRWPRTPWPHAPWRARIRGCRPSCRPPAPGRCTEWVQSITTVGAIAQHVGDIAEIDDEVVVAERVAALGQPDFTGPRLAGLFVGIAHVRARKELRLLDIHRSAASALRRPPGRSGGRGRPESESRRPPRPRARPATIRGCR